MKYRMLKYSALVLWAVLLHFNMGYAQCSTPISSFPYQQDFEISNGGFTINGTASSWDWGTPAKPTINSAASGTKCWITGGLNSAAYNDGEASWLQSPCFNFSSLNLPSISFNIWWETETDFDGSNVQYSIDNGTSWINVGSDTDPTDCLDSNWYNTSSVRFLGSFGTNANGWCGNVQSGGGSCRNGNGSGKWVPAKKLMPYLANQPTVIFRITFGAGTQCNSYDGVAIDDFTISNAPSVIGNVDINCIDEKTVECTLTSNTCPSTYLWDFGDPSSGVNNTSNQAIPRHEYVSPGTYTVTLTVKTPGDINYTYNNKITVIGLQATVVKAINCTISNSGILAVAVTGQNTNPLNYSWNTSPVQNNDTAYNVPAGNYTITVSSLNTCTNNAAITIMAPVFSIEDSVQQPGCLFNMGKIVVAIKEGLAPFQYNWLPNVSTDSIAQNLMPNNYRLTITDSRNCVISNTYTIANLPTPALQVRALQMANCNGQQLGIADATVVGGTAPFSYNWLTNPTQSTAKAINLNPGWQTVIVTDANGCLATDSVNISLGGICDNVYFPNCFSPAGSNKNFGPIGNVLDITQYQLQIFNRFGQLVFSSTNPLVKWDGNFKQSTQPMGNYAWVARYTFKNNRPKIVKGSLLLLR
jgi:gliding motility-associated-like protein